MTKHKIQNNVKAQIPNDKTLVLIFVILILNLFCALNFDICHLAFAQDKIVAIVNNEIITQRDLDDFINFMRMQLAQEFKGQELETRIELMKQELLDKLIEDRLILQEAIKNNIKIDENRVRARIDNIRSRYPTETEFQRALSQQGLTLADIETKIREQLLTYAIIEIKVTSKITVNPPEVTHFYNKNIEKFIIPQQREVSSITMNDAKLAAKIFNELNEGGDLSGICRQYSLNPNQMRARKNGELKEEIEDIIFGLKLNEISQPFKVKDIFYIFRLDKIIPPRQQSLSEARQTIYTFLFNRKMEEKLTLWLDELKKQSYIKISPD